MDALTWCSKLLELLTDRAREWLKEELIHVLKYEARVAELEYAVKKLQGKRDKIQSKVDEEKNRYDRGVPSEVKGWINEVNKLISKCDKFNGERCHALAKFDLGKHRHTFANFEFTARDLRLPKPGIRHRLSREAYDITKQINGLLLQTQKLDTLSYLLIPPSLYAFLHNVGYESFPSRDAIMCKINAAFEDPSVRIIGLHGWSGVGKTTLVKQVARKALEAKLKMFDVVAMANVTRNPDIRKIQGQIADMLGMKLEDESDIARAARIRKRLRSEKESTLIILDDLWAALDFNMLGIPLDNDGDGEGRMTKTREQEIPFGNNKEGKMLGKRSMTMTKPKTEKYDSDIIMMKSKVSPSASSIKSVEALSRYKGCKVLLVSESKQVLLNQMEGMEKSIYSLEVLQEKEAETLFKEKVGIGDKYSEFEKLAAQISNKCNGLPMTIVTTARALKNQSRSSWEDVHRQLESKKITAPPELSTRLCYDLLENEELKGTFLLCARMGPDALIMDLVKYCIGLGFLKGIYTVSEARSRVYALVGSLKLSGLLSDSYSGDHFNMPNIVRRAALSIASSEKHVLTMIKEKVDDWPDEDKLERYTAICLHHCDIIMDFPISMTCPRLRFFHVNNNDSHLKIPVNLFEGMKELKVLILTGFNLSPFPSSIRCLTKLRMLCLEHCKLGDDLSIIGELKYLRILSFSGSDIVKLPSELKNLTRLQIFDISNCSRLREIPSNVISSFISLEELYMRNTFVQWKVEEQANQCENASLSELRYLNQLITLDIQIQDIAYLPKNLFFDKLSNYNIVVGNLSPYLEMEFRMPEQYEASRVLAMQLKNLPDIHSQNGIKILFERVEILVLEELNGVQDLFYRLNLKGFPYLKHLIVNNSEIESLIKLEGRPGTQNEVKAFPKLESLYLYNLMNMDKICFSNLSAPSFGKLKAIKINLCGQLENIFVFSVVCLLTVLETIEVSECNGLKEIVNIEGQSNDEHVMFPELRSLALRSLSDIFLGFCPTSSASEEPKILFNEKVKVSKLEKMLLSSIQIGKIWNESLNSGFENLIQLDVNGCWNLKYLMSYSMAKSLVSLQSLFISDCAEMEHIFLFGKNSYAEGNIFPKLKNIKLSSMNSLVEIWDSEPLTDSFGKLDTLIIEECDKLVHIFPRYMKGIFQSLCNLRVTNCRSMKAVFELNDMDITNLQDEVLKLSNLSVHYCGSLENIFPVSVAMCLHNFEQLVVSNCNELREIVSKGEDNSEIRSSAKVGLFLKLTTVKIWELPRLQSFCPKGYELKCRAMKDISIQKCDKLEAFGLEDPVFSEEVINQLKSLQIESWHEKSPSSYTEEGNHQRDNLEELCLSRLKNTKILYSFFHRNPNLKCLSFHDCSFTDIVPVTMPPNDLGVVPKLKILKLTDLPHLKTIGFERDLVLQRIELLVLENCPCLVNILPSSVSLVHLTNLEVFNCNKLEKLMTPSTAKSLGLLNTMKVISCDALKEIVGNEDENEGKVHIVFRQLKVLELVSLKRLDSFCGSKRCTFEFPSLEKLVVSACPQMENFTEGDINMPILQGIYMVPGKEKKRCCWFGNVKDTIKEIFQQQKFYEGMKEISVIEHPKLEQAWHGALDLQSSWFYSLKTLKLYKCDIHPHAIPSNILPSLKSLNKLEVSYCKQVKVIFYMEDTDKVLETAFQLKTLILEGLPELTHVWDKDKDKDKELVAFENMRHVTVNGCNNLLSLFPMVVARKLKKLKILEIIGCDQISQIIGDLTSDVKESFVFSCLTTLDLDNLPMLTNFYPVECPMLKCLSVVHCFKLEVFHLQLFFSEGEGSSTSVTRQPLFLETKAIPNLDGLMLDRKGISGLSSWKPTNLEHLSVLFLKLDVKEDEKPTFPFEILERAPKLQYLIVAQCKDLQIFLQENSKSTMLEHLKTLALREVSGIQHIGSEGCKWLKGVYEKLQELFVDCCPDLKILLNPVPSETFKSLKLLRITECPQLKFLFTSSTANKLVHLELIAVENCKSIKAILGQEIADSQGITFNCLHRIILTNLSSLECFYSDNGTLNLPSLKRVDIWKCPKMDIFSLGSVHAESFRGIQVSSFRHDELLFHDDCLNTTLLLVQDHLVFEKSPLLKEIWLNSKTLPNWSFCNLNSLVIKGCEFLSKVLLPSHILPFLSNLKTLQVEECNSVKAIFIYTRMGPHGSLCLPLLDTLDVRNCQELVELVAKDEMATDTEEASDQELIIFPRLQHLCVEGCQMLKFFATKVQNFPDSHSFPKNQQAFVSLKKVTPRLRNLTPSTVSFSSLIRITVVDCDGLTYLFTSSTAKTLCVLERMEITNCRSLQTVMLTPEDEEEHDKDAITFKMLKTLSLSSLPKLECFYSGSSALKFESLVELSFTKCRSTKVFRVGDTVPVKLMKVIINGIHCEEDVNSVIMQQVEVEEE